MEGTSRARAWIILLGLAGGLLAFQLIQKSKSWTAEGRAKELGQELLAATTPEQAAAIARELGALDEAAIKPLVAGLLSEEPLVSVSAAEEIARRLAEWRKVSRKESAPKVAALARQLALESESIPPEHLRRARDWAGLMLLWPLPARDGRTGDLLADCEMLLQLSLPDEEVLAERMALLEQKSSPPDEGTLVQPPQEGLPSQVPLDDANLPPIVSPADVAPQGAAASLGSDAPEESDTAPLPPHPREPRGIYVPRARPIEDSAEPATPGALPGALPAEEPALLPPERASATRPDLQSLPAIELMRDLHGGDAPAVAEAEAELSRRGYKPAHLALARQVTDGDRAVRLRLVESLPRTRGIDPRPWLLLLAQDTDEEVRTSARNLLRTSQDAELLQRLR